VTAALPLCCGSSGSSCCVAWLALLAARCCFAAARRGQQQLDRCALDSRRTPPTTQQQVEAMAHVVDARGVLWFERLLLLCGVAGAVGSTLLLRSRAARPSAA